MAYTTNVPKPVFGDTGFVAPTENALIAGAFADLNTAFNGNLDPGLSTPQGQIASTEAAVIGDNNATFLWFIAGVDPATSSGRMQDAIARIYFIARKPALPTVVSCNITGLPNTVIPVGTFAADTNGNEYLSQGQITINSAGTGSGQFSNLITGPIPCAGSTLTRITQAIFGWDTITNPEDGILGQDVEDRSEFEDRRSSSTAVNSIGSLPSVLGAVASVSGVLDVFVYDNFASTAQLFRGVLVSAHSLYVCAAGGTDEDVAFAIWTRKAPGCDYTGNTTVTITDPSPLYAPPAPSYDVTFERPDSISFFVVVNVTDSPNVPSNARTLVQNAVISAFAGTDGGPRARIGSIIYASRFYAPVALLGPWARQIVSIKLSTQMTAQITGSISGNTMTVTAVVSGHLAVGQLVTGSGTNILQATEVIEFISGTGLTGTYRVTQSQTISSRNMDLYDLVDDVSMNMNQAPTVSGSGVMLLLS